jgi:hypothetical protein
MREEGERETETEREKERKTERQREAESLSAYLGLFERKSCYRNNVPTSPHKSLIYFSRESERERHKLRETDR